MRKVLFLLSLASLSFACSDDSDSPAKISGCDCLKYVEINEHIINPGEEVPVEWELNGNGQPAKYSNKCEDDGQIVFYDETSEPVSDQIMVTQIRHIVKCTNNEATN